MCEVPQALEHSCWPPQLFGSLPPSTGTRPLPQCLRRDSGMFYFICPSVLTWPHSQMFGFQQLNVWMLTPWVPVSSFSGSLLMKTFTRLCGEKPGLEMLVHAPTNLWRPAVFVGCSLEWRCYFRLSLAVRSPAGKVLNSWLYQSSVCTDRWRSKEVCLKRGHSQL